MTEGKHTKEPWIITGDGFILCVDRQANTATKIASNMREADGVRACACVNICEGIANDDLDQAGLLERVATAQNLIPEMVPGLVEACEQLVAEWRDGKMTSPGEKAVANALEAVKEKA